MLSRWSCWLLTILKCFRNTQSNKIVWCRFKNYTFFFLVGLGVGGGEGYCLLCKCATVQVCRPRRGRRVHHAAPSTESILILLFHRVRSTSSLWIMSIPAVSVRPCVRVCARVRADVRLRVCRRTFNYGKVLLCVGDRQCWTTCLSSGWLTVCFLERLREWKNKNMMTHCV